MFGREYANHLDVLIQSFEQINENYQNKIKKGEKASLVEKLKRFYISLFGIPEIGFQIRSLYFKKILTSHGFEEDFKSILDAGCGIGAYTFLLARMFKKAIITGGEIDKLKLKNCEILADELDINNATFTYFDITKKQNTAKYNLIVNVDVLEHIDHYELALENFSNLLKKGGYLYIHAPQPNQKRIFNSLGKWHHDDHVREGITKNELENNLKKLGFKIITSKETFGFFGKLAWEINHITLSKNFVLAGIIFPFLYPLTLLDLLWKNKNGLGIAVFSQKK